jgi:hypothetical protein
MTSDTAGALAAYRVCSHSVKARVLVVTVSEAFSVQLDAGPARVGNPLPFDRRVKSVSAGQV